MISLDSNRFVQLATRFYQSSKLLCTFLWDWKLMKRDDIVVSHPRWIRLMLDILP
jgi:hypothetical protein